MRLKYILIALVMALVVIVGGGATLVLSMDFNRYKGLISTRVKQATGRDLTISGDFRLVPSLAPLVAVENVSFANMPGGSRPQMLTLKRLEVQLELLPLLSRQIKIDRLILDGAAIFLETDSKGRGNWVFNGTGRSDAAVSGNTGVPLPSVGLVQIRDCLLTYRDGIAGTTRSLRIDRMTSESESGHLNLDLLALVGKASVSIQGSLGAPELLFGGDPFPFDLIAKSGDSRAAAKGMVGDVARMRKIAFDLSAKGKSLADLDELLDSKLPHVGPYALSGKFADAAGGGYNLRGLNLVVGGSSLGGDLAFLPGIRPKVIAHLAAARIDLLDFGVTPGGTGHDPTSKDGRVFPGTLLHLALLNKLDGEVKLTVTQLIRAPITLSKVDMMVKLAAGRLQITPFSAGIGGGTLVSSLTVDGTRTPAPVALDLTETEAEAGTLLQTLAGINVLSGGRSNVRINVRGTGDSIRSMMASLNGRVDYVMGAGNINNDYAKLFLADLFTLFSFGSSDGRSNMKCAIGRFGIKGGLATAEQLIVETRGATIIGEGTINLATEGLDLHLAPHATSANLSTLAIPMTVRGTLANPQVAPDAAAIPGHTVGTVVTAPLTVLSTIGNAVGIGSEGGGGVCGEATSANRGGSPQASEQSSSPLEGLMNGVGSGAKDASDALKSILP